MAGGRHKDDKWLTKDEELSKNGARCCHASTKT